jgi:hypothetical protein
VLRQFGTLALDYTELIMAQKDGTPIANSTKLVVRGPKVLVDLPGVIFLAVGVDAS